MGPLHAKSTFGPQVRLSYRDEPWKRRWQRGPIIEDGLMSGKYWKLVHTAVQHVRTKTLSDEYLNWICFANAGMLSRGNIYSMNHAIKNLPTDDPVVEVGSFCGLSTNAMSYLLSAHGRENSIITSDKWLFEGAERGGCLGDSQILHSEYREFVKSSFMRNVEFFSPHNKSYAIEEISDDFFGLWKRGATTQDVFGRSIQLGGKISFCYIDGNHTYAFARRDFENVDQYLELGGFVLFDDSSDEG